MRRLAATTLTIGSLVVGLGAYTAPAQAAAPKKWAYPGGFPSIEAWGTYNRTGNKIVFRGKLRDLARNGNAACVRFLSTETDDDNQWDRFKLTVPKPGGGWRFFDGVGTGTFVGQSSNTGHLYVQECRMHRRSGRWFFQPWKRIY